jgi:hypothetical protein
VEGGPGQAVQRPDGGHRGTAPVRAGPDRAAHAARLRGAQQHHVQCRPGLLTLIHGLLGWPLPAGLTLAYLTASGLGYLLNRALNFRSHAAVGPPAAVYTVVVIVNYLVCILGVGTGLAALGVDYRLARAAGACCENGVHVHRAALGGVPRCPAPGRSGSTSRIISRRAIGPSWHN